MDPTGHASPLLSDSDLAELRGGTHRNLSFHRLHSRCLAYVLDYRQYRHLLTVDDGEEIVSQAVVEELRALKDPEIGAKEVSIRFKRALNRVRARYVRESRRRVAGVAAPVVQADILMAIHYKEMAHALSGYIGRAINAMRDRDRNLLIDSYGLENHGLAKRGASPVFVNPGGHKVGLWRARKRFLRELRRLIEETSTVHQNLDLIRALRILIESSALMIRLPGRAGRRARGDHSERMSF
ncbi:MAG TPA: hypothetical protein VF173_34290 [Thermoanaerobaculia bacterium]|nr:hypothetical protein [Thermoanaerobaculia bacterium]